ncbi:MAG: glycosyltransferase family 2 protein [Acidobacteria bacterium]|nr:glycosyltransferase family 2 protein [Acidobacteriota bacterium]
MDYQYALVIPALNEAETIGILLQQIPRHLFSQMIVVDNGSQDRTGEIALAAGAEVVREPRRGYGQACLSGLERLQPAINAVVFMDADLSDDPQDLERLIRHFDQGHWHMVIGSRVLGAAERGSLTPLQRFGNWLTTRLIALFWGMHFTDLGPMRVLRRDSLESLKLSDHTFGWTVEMQVKAAQLGLKTCEIPVRYRCRRQGRSKISGSIVGSIRAGVKILWTVYRCWRSPLISTAPDP